MFYEEWEYKEFSSELHWYFTCDYGDYKDFPTYLFWRTCAYFLVLQSYFDFYGGGYFIQKQFLGNGRVFTFIFWTILLDDFFFALLDFWICYPRQFSLFDL